MTETSFTTKFLEYTQYGKPVIVWGPPYCQPVLTANAKGAGLAVESDNPADVLLALEQLRMPDRWRELAEGAWRAATGIFDHDRIHAVFVDSLQHLLRKRPTGQGGCPPLSGTAIP